MKYTEIVEYILRLAPDLPKESAESIAHVVIAAKNEGILCAMRASWNYFARHGAAYDVDSEQVTFDHQTFSRETFWDTVWDSEGGPIVR